jgi:serine/threonine protein kinase
MAKAKKSGKTTRNKKGNISVTEVPSSMPLTKSIINNDFDLFKKTVISLNLSLFKNQNITSFQCEKTQGERLTKGTSTPVYTIKVILESGEEKHFILKFIKLQERSNPKFLEESYKIEYNFYKDELIRNKVNENNLSIPNLYCFEEDKKFQYMSFFMNDISINHQEHPEGPNITQAKIALEWLAKWHSLFWMEHWNWPKDLWKEGNFWVLNRKGKNNLQTIPQTWNSLIKNLNKKYSYVAQEKGFHDFGKRITNAAQGLYQVLNNTRYRTIIHGDFKPANMFFNNDSCSVCDFQFSGAGVPLQDVVYFLFPDALMNFSGNEEKLLKYYFDTLKSIGIDSMDFKLCVKLYELCQLDYLRYLLENGWMCYSEEEVKIVQKCNIWLSKYDNYQILSENEYSEKINEQIY